MCVLQLRRFTPNLGTSVGSSEEVLMTQLCHDVRLSASPWVRQNNPRLHDAQSDRPNYASLAGSPLESSDRSERNSRHGLTMGFPEREGRCGCISCAFVTSGKIESLRLMQFPAPSAAGFWSDSTSNQMCQKVLHARIHACEQATLRLAHRCNITWDRDSVRPT